MSELFRNKYRSSSSRLQNWNYSSPGMYFITICTADREHYFGEIKNGVMLLSPAGAIANVLWFEIKNHAQDVELGEYIVMPNHVHGIDIERYWFRVGFVGCKDKACLVSTSTAPKSQIPNRIPTFSKPGKSTISSIIGGYKSAVTKHCNRLGLEFKWQSRFYDRIIRNEQSFHTISNYIINNPKNLEDDKFF